MSTLRRLGLAAVLYCVPTLAGTSDFRVAEAAKNGDIKAVRSLLGQHADVNAAQPDGETALAWAVHHDDVLMAEFLIQAGANVNAANEYGETPLTLACANANAASELSRSYPKTAFMRRIEQVR